MANGVRKVYERVLQDGRAIIVTDKNKDNYDWADIPDGSLFIDTETGLEYIKLKGQSDWLPSHTKNDGTICIAKDAIIETETFIVKEINDGDLVCENENGDIRHFMQDEDGYYVIELESGTYGMGKDYLSVFINDIFLRTQQNEGIQEMTPNRFKLLENPALNMKITAKYYKTVRIGNPYPRIFLNNEDPGVENVEEGDIWFDLNEKLDGDIIINPDSDTKIPWSMISGTPTTLDGYKITDRVSLQGHKHTKNDITGFPSSLPANGGSAETAERLATPRTINGVSFDGSTNIKIPVGIKTINGTEPDASGNLEFSGIPIGFITLSLSKIIPTGWLACTGGTYSASSYKHLWNFILEQGEYKTFAQWQKLYDANGGNVPYFAINMSGEESTWTFKTPSIKGWVRGTDKLSEIGTYLEAGLPNIIGTFHGNRHEKTYTGAFYDSGTTYKVDGDSQYNSSTGTAFDASRCNPIYGKANTVQPASVVGIWLVKAFDNVINTTDQDLKEISTGLTRTETRVSELETRVNVTEKAYITEARQSGAIGYRVWSDGFVEQWGTTASINADYYTVTFPKAFTTTNYYINFTVVGESATKDSTYGHQISGRTTTNFVATDFLMNNLPITWYACGY